jgi:prevent-host-death family protein
MEITATQFKTNLGKYLEEAGREEIVITKNGKAIARLLGPEGPEGPDARSGGMPKEVYTYTPLEEVCAEFLHEDVAVYDAGMPGIQDGGVYGDWTLMHGDEPVARLTPIKKLKRTLGFFHLTPDANGDIPDSDAALFEPLPKEIMERWENEEW